MTRKTRRIYLFILFRLHSVTQSAHRCQSVRHHVHVDSVKLVASQPGRHTVLHDIAQAQVGLAVARRHQRRSHYVLHNTAPESVHPLRVHRVGRQRIRAWTTLAAHSGQHRRDR